LPYFYVFLPEACIFSHVNEIYVVINFEYLLIKNASIIYLCFNINMMYSLLRPLFMNQSAILMFFKSLLEKFIQNVNGAYIFLFIPYFVSTFVTSESNSVET
jgi:hypothetical protein